MRKHKRGGSDGGGGEAPGRPDAPEGAPDLYVLDDPGGGNVRAPGRIDNRHDAASGAAKGQKMLAICPVRSVTYVSGRSHTLEFFRTGQRGRRAFGVRGFSRQALCARTTIAIARQNLTGI